MMLWYEDKAAAVPGVTVKTDHGGRVLRLAPSLAQHCCLFGVQLKVPPMVGPTPKN